MIPFAILAPDLQPDHARLLRAAFNHVRLEWEAPVDSLPSTGHPRNVLSVGRAGLDAWHDFGLIGVGANHGDVFTHRAPVGGRSYTIMVVEHPGAMAQLSMTKHSAREDMVRDLTRWRDMLIGGWGQKYPSLVCGGCLKRRGGIVRPAEHWADELDGVGLCEDHYRRRANYTRKRRTVKVADRGKPEHQIPGQGEMFADGQKVMVSKVSQS